MEYTIEYREESVGFFKVEAETEEAALEEWHKQVNEGKIDFSNMEFVSSSEKIHEPEIRVGDICRYNNHIPGENGEDRFIITKIYERPNDFNETTKFFSALFLDGDTIEEGTLSLVCRTGMCSAFSQYTAENLIAKRESLSESVKENTAADLASFGITIVSIAIEDIDFTDAFTNAVEAKQVAAQNKLTAQTQQEQKTMEERAAAERAKIAAQADADKAIIAANADLEVVKVQAEAALYAGEREAEMNQRISKSLTGELVSYYWIKQWNGELPSTVLSNDGNYMLSLNNPSDEK